MGKRGGRKKRSPFDISELKRCLTIEFFFFVRSLHLFLMALDRTCVNVLLTISKIVKNTNFCDFMSVFFNLLKITHGSKQPL